MEKIDIYEYLEQYLDEEVIYIPNTGNAGDSLIAHAAYQIFDKVGLQYQQGDIHSVYPGKTVFYGGGGNLVAPYENALNFIENNYDKAKKLVVLPHTIQSYPEMIAKLGDNVDLICRELDSYKFVTQHVTKAHILLADDLALNIDVEKTLNEGDKLFSFNDEFFSRNLKRKIRMAAYTIKNILSSSILNSFRTDIEKTDIAIPFNNIDVSQAFATDNMTKRYSHEAAYRIFKFMKGFSTINTNRLHICIAGVLLNQKVNFHKNSYNKNYSIYEFSMRNKYQNVTFVK